MIIYAGVCSALIRLRRLELTAHAIRIPFAPWLALFGIVVSLTLLMRLGTREWLLMGVTAGIATLNWWWAQRQRGVPECVS